MTVGRFFQEKFSLSGAAIQCGNSEDFCCAKCLDLIFNVKAKEIRKILSNLSQWKCAKRVLEEIKRNKRRQRKR